MYQLNENGYNYFNTVYLTCLTNVGECKSLKKSEQESPKIYMKSLRGLTENDKLGCKTISEVLHSPCETGILISSLLLETQKESFKSNIKKMKQTTWWNSRI